MMDESSHLTTAGDELAASTVVAPEADLNAPLGVAEGGGEVPEDLSAVEQVIGTGDPQRVGRFRFFLDGARWEWSDAVARMHGYEPGTVVPTTELLLRHKHPEDREKVAAVLELVLGGQPFSSRHRIIDTTGHTHWVVVVGDLMRDEMARTIERAGETWGQERVDAPHRVTLAGTRPFACKGK